MRALEGHDGGTSGEALLSTGQGVRLRERLLYDVYDGGTSGGMNRWLSLMRCL